MNRRTEAAARETDRIRREQYLAELAELSQARAERDITRAPVPTRRHQPKITRHVSREQRIANSQSRNPIKAIYTDESKYNQTPVVHDEDERTMTREVGPGDEHNSTYRSGKATQSATGAGNKRSRPYNRANGGGRNKPTKTDYEALADKFLENLL